MIGIRGEPVSYKLDGDLRLKGFVLHTMDGGAVAKMRKYLQEVNSA